MHPEGARSTDGTVYRGRTGALRVAMATGAPVVPVVLDGTDRMNPRGRKLLRFTKVRISIQPARRYPAAVHRAQVRVATDLLMREMSALSGRPYVDRYAATFAAESRSARVLGCQSGLTPVERAGIFCWEHGRNRSLA
ncbi:lysophospholipid acyltransferase family protein [Nocardia sp. NPDC058497]|uniref:lysophospholipid acyltransferase family protein n=1 Tax=Nocardia sp. NPDC058497 TaxID=3346529 RepID=UPI00364BC684